METYHRRRRTPWAIAGAAAAGVWLLRARPFRVEIEGSSMEPSLLPGEWALAVRRRLKVGAVVVVEHPTRPDFELVKRVVAAPGDAVGGRRLGAAEWWVQGDASGASTDSRAFGPVPRSAVRGRVVLVYSPWRNRRML
jgi:inner membrane protease subunit 1